MRRYTKPLALNLLFLAAFLCLIGYGILLGKHGNHYGFIRLLLLALLLIGIGSASNLFIALGLCIKHQQKGAIAYAVGLAVMLPTFLMLRAIIIKLVAFDLPTAMIKALITGKLPGGSPMYW